MFQNVSPLDAPRRWVLWLVLISPLVQLSGSANAQADEIKNSVEEAGKASPSTIPLRARMDFQAGAFHRFAGRRWNERSEPYLVIFDLNIPANRNRNQSTWSGGMHVAFDGDGGPRLGPMATWQKPLDQSGSFQFQLGTCVYLTSYDDEISARSPSGQGTMGQVVMPGFYLEALISWKSLVSLAAAMEAIPVEYFDEGRISKTTDTHFYIGGKGGGKLGGVTVIVGAIVLGIALASSPLATF
ncbi:MAG: hypothetical protein ABIK96_12550 [bacterium]